MLLAPNTRRRPHLSASRARRAVQIWLTGMAPKKTLGVGMIGYNFMGKAHSNAWRQVGRFFDLPVDIRLDTICGRSGAAVAKAAAQFGWEKPSTDWRAVVADPAIDIVDICTPNDSHAEIAIAAARQGKAILCE